MLASIRALVKFARWFPVTRLQMARAESYDRPGLLSPLGAKHPAVAGVLLVPLVALPMMLLFDVLSWFRHPLACAVVWTIAGCFMGLAMGWYWSYTRRMGEPPNVG